MAKIPLTKAIFTFKGMPKKIPQPIVRALNRTAQHVMVLASREVAKNYTIKQRDAKSMMRIYPKASISNLNTVIRAESRLLTPYHFKYTPTGGGITMVPGSGWKAYPKRPKTYVTIKKGNKKLLKHAFVAYIGSKTVTRNLWYFKPGDKHTKDNIKSFRSVSLPQMIANKKVMDVVDKDRQEFFEKQFLHEFDYLTKKEGWK